MNNQDNDNGMDNNGQQPLFGNPNPNTLFSQQSTNNNSGYNPVGKTLTIITTSIISIAVILLIAIPSYHSLEKFDGGHHDFMSWSKQLHDNNSSNSSDSNIPNDSSNSSNDENDDTESYSQQFKRNAHQSGDWNFTPIHPSHQDYVNEDPDLSHLKPWTTLSSARIYNSHADRVALGMYKRLQGDYESGSSKLKIKGHHITLTSGNGSYSKMYVTGVYERQHVGLLLNGAEMYYWSKNDYEDSSLDDVIIANQQNNGIEFNDDNHLMVQPLNDVDEPAPENNKYLASNLINEHNSFHKVSQFGV